MTSILCTQMQEKLGPDDVKYNGEFEDLTDNSETATPSPTQDCPNSPTDIPRPELAAAKLFIAQQLSRIPNGLELRKCNSPFRLGVWAKVPLPRGTKYGPYVPRDAKTNPWEVVDGRDRDYIRQDWWHHIQEAIPPMRGNLRSIVSGDKIQFETIVDVSNDEELLIGNSSSDSSNSIDQQNCRSPNDKFDDRGHPEHEEDLDEEISRNQCLSCDKTFPDYEELDNHLVNTHGLPGGQYRCEHCMRRFAWRPNLIQHKTIHGEFKTYTCENCTKVFTDPLVLQKHIRVHHAGARAHACRECGKTFATSSGLKQHTHIHSSVKPFRCEVCFKAYTQFSNLCRHKRMHGECKQTVKCNKCDQPFNTSTSLTKHKRFCDTATTLSVPPPHTMSEAKLHQSPLGSSRLPNAAASSLMMCPPPPLPFLTQSLLSSYPGFPAFPSLVPNHHQSLLPPPLFLPFSSMSSPIRDHPTGFPSCDRFRDDRMPSMGIKTPSPRPITPESLRHDIAKESIELKSDFNTSSNSMPLDSPKPKTEIKMEENSAEEEDAKLTDNEEYDLNDVQEESTPKKPRDKKETPLDLTMRKRELWSLPDDIEPDSTESLAEPSAKKIKFTSSEDLKTPEVKKRTEHSFFRIRELLKDTISSSSEASSTVSPPVSRPESPTKSLAYPRPIHPTLLEACKNLERNNCNNFFNAQMPSNRYPLMSPFLPTSRTGLGLRPPSLDVFTARLHSIRNSYNSNPCRPYDILSSHIHNSKDKYSCKFCGKVFPRSANLTRHLRTHTGEQPYKCKYCERSFSISSNLQRHVRNIHNKEKPFRCTQCDRSFGQQTNLERHLKKHADGVVDVPDSPEAPDSSVCNDMPSNDEIRLFVHKVTPPRPEHMVIDPDEAYCNRKITMNIDFLSKD